MIGDEFAKYLESEGFGVLGTDIFHNFQPDSPDNCITTYNINAPVLAESSSLSVDNCCVQVMVRNKNEELSKTILRNIHLNFIGFGGEKLVPSSNMTITESAVDTNPYSIGKDEKGRNECTVTYRLRVQTFNNKNRL